MNELDLRPRSSTEIVDAAFQLFRRSPMQLILAVALVYVPWLVIRLVFDLGISSPIMRPVQAVGLLGGGIVVYAIVGGVVTILASDIYLGRTPDVAASFRQTASRIAPLIVAGWIAAFFIAFGFVLLLIPGLYALARFFAVTQAVVLEDKGVGGSLSRSGGLSVGLKRHLLNTILLIGLVLIAISVGINLVLSMLQSKVIANVIDTAIAVVLYPLFGVTQTLLYYDARIRKEGFDVEFLARADATPLGPESAAI